MKPIWNKGLTKETDERVKKYSNKLIGRKNTWSWNRGKKNVYSKETLEKMSLAKKGYHPSTEFKKGHLMSEETKNKISLTLKGVKKSDEAIKHMTLARPRENEHWVYGKHHSEETKKKMSLAHKGHLTSEETRRKIGLAHKGKIITEEQKEKIREKRLHRVYPKKDTSIEIKIQNGLTNLGIEFEKHKLIENFVQSDITISKYQNMFLEKPIVIFCDGDYFHSNPQFYPDRTKLDTTQNKNLIRDTIVNEFFNRNGKYIVLRFWEHDIKNNFEDKVLDEIIFTINEEEVRGLLSL